MAITGYSVITGGDTEELAANVATAINAGKQPFGGVFESQSRSGRTVLSQAVIEGSPDGSLGDIETRLAAAEASIIDHESRIDALEAP